MYDQDKPDSDRQSFYTLVSEGKHSPGTYYKIALMFGKPQSIIRNTTKAKIVRQDFVNLGRIAHDKQTGQPLLNEHGKYYRVCNPRKHKGPEVLEQYREDAKKYNRFPLAYAAMLGVIVDGKIFAGDQSVNRGTRIRPLHKHLLVKADRPFVKGLRWKCLRCLKDFKTDIVKARAEKVFDNRGDAMEYQRKIWITKTMHVALKA